MTENNFSSIPTTTQRPSPVHMPITVHSTTLSLDVEYEREHYREQTREKCEPISPITVNSTALSIDVEYEREHYREQTREKCEPLTPITVSSTFIPIKVEHEREHYSESFNTVSSIISPITHAHAHHPPPPHNDQLPKLPPSASITTRRTHLKDFNLSLSYMIQQLTVPTFCNLHGSIDHQYLHPSGIFFICTGTGRGCMEIDPGNAEQAVRAQRIFYHNLDEYRALHNSPPLTPCPFHSSTNFPLYYPPTYNPCLTFPVYIQPLITEFFFVLLTSTKKSSNTLSSTHIIPFTPSRQSSIHDFFFPTVSLSTFMSIPIEQPHRVARVRKTLLKKIYIMRASRVCYTGRKRLHARNTSSPSTSPLSHTSFTQPPRPVSQTTFPLPFNCHLHTSNPPTIPTHLLSIHASIFIPLHQRRLSSLTTKALIHNLSPDMERSTSKVNFFLRTPPPTPISHIKAPRLRHSLFIPSLTYTLTPQTNYTHHRLSHSPTFTKQVPSCPLYAYIQRHILRVHSIITIFTAYQHQQRISISHQYLSIVFPSRSKKTQRPPCFSRNISYCHYSVHTSAYTFQRLCFLPFFFLFFPLLSSTLYAFIPYGALVVGIG